VSALPQMEERDESSSNAADILGFIGLALAVLGLAEVPLLYRLCSLFGSSVCLTASFYRQRAWPRWARWVLALGANAFLTLVAWWAIRDR